MKRSIQLLCSAIVICAVMDFSSAFGNSVKSNQPSNSIVSSDDTLGTIRKMRVVFIPNSDYRNFRIGIESSARTDINIQVLNRKGLVIYSSLLENVKKRLEEINFSFLKKGEYTVKVTNQEDEYTKILIIP